jgi:hypothetical protein
MMIPTTGADFVRAAPRFEALFRDFATDFLDEAFLAFTQSILA